MRNLGLVAFGVTTCVLVPTVRHGLDAGPRQVARLVAPGERSIVIGKTTVDIAVDRAFVDPGDKVHLTLTARSEARQRVTLDVLVLESSGTGGGRVELPPNRIARDSVTLDVAAGTATRQLAFTLRGNRGEMMEGVERFGHYTFLVMPPRDADRFEKLRRAAQRVADPMQDRGGKNTAFQDAYRSIAPDGDGDGDGAAADGTPEGGGSTGFGTAGQIARLEVNTRPMGSPLSILAPETGRTGEDLAIKVRVHNPSKRPLSQVSVELATSGYGLANAYLGIDPDQTTVANPNQDVALNGHETKEVVFHVTARTTGTLGLFATVRCDAEDCYHYAAAQGLNDGAIDAVDIVPADAPPVVGVK